MNILISYSSGQPIYQQIVHQVKKIIVSGDLQEGDALPSMRLLAKELRISVITTKRAYEELQSEGFINSIPGKGSFVTVKNLDLIREQRYQEIENHMQTVMEKAAVCGLSLAELHEMLTLFYQGEQ